MNNQIYDIDYSQLHWNCDYMYSEIYDDTVSEEDDVVVGLYALKDIPQINMYIDMNRNKVLEVWTEYEEDEV